MPRLAHLTAMTAAAGLLLFPLLAMSQPNATGSSQQTTTTTSTSQSGQPAARDAAQGRTPGDSSQSAGPPAGTGTPRPPAPAR